jgi:hypothetical protein
MNTFKALLLAAALVGASVAATDADAHGRHRHRSHVGIWFGVPGPVFYPHYYPRYYYPPAVVVPAPAAPPVYIEQSQGVAPAPGPTTQSATAYWYFCRDTETYYPYVQQCSTPWERVVPQSAPPS